MGPFVEIHPVDDITEVVLIVRHAGHVAVVVGTDGHDDVAAGARKLLEVMEVDLVLDVLTGQVRQIVNLKEVP